MERGHRGQMCRFLNVYRRLIIDIIQSRNGGPWLVGQRERRKSLSMDYGNFLICLLNFS
jgi:hypothetical protein